jgi:nucleoid-associated protein YgaU
VSKKRILLGLSIIAGGVCASLPFRRETPIAHSPRTGVSGAAEAVVPLLAQPLAPPSVKSTATPSPYLDDGSQRGIFGSGLRSSGDPARDSLANSLAEEVPLPREQVHSPPMLPVSFQVKEPEQNRLDPWQPARLEEGLVGPREYRIRKLDTLEDLAERFLGSKDRADEIFAANRGVLQNRHILPLGAVLRIPAGKVPTEPAQPDDGDLQPVRSVP